MLNQAGNMPGELTGPRLKRGHGGTILVVEPDENLRDSLKNVLRANGYNILLAADGADGERSFNDHSHEIGLILLDMGLPKMNGEEILARILGSNPGVKVIVMSGSVYPDVEAGLLRNGAAAYLPKPYSMSDLLVMIGDVVNGQSPRD